MLWIIAGAAATALLVAGFFFILLPGKLDGARHIDSFRGLNVAHRGLHSRDKSIPENSLTAFSAAVEKGYGIELDIQLTKDSQVVVFHDDALERVCGVKRRVDSTTLRELREMRLEGTKESIPLFSEVLSLVDGRSPLVVELKTGRHKHLLCKKALALLESYSGPFCIESFDPRIVGWFYRHAPHVLRGQLSAPPAHLKAGIIGDIVGYLLSNFWARPQFIAYRVGPHPFTVRWAEKRAMRVAWTARPDDDHQSIQKANDTVIFEYYSPPARFR